MPDLLSLDTPQAPQLLLIDNYDSFTYNLVQYFGELGAQLTVWRNDQFTLPEVKELAPTAIVLSPGPCTPAEAGLCVPLIQQLGAHIPMLGVCLGHQSIGAAFGATVKRAKQAVHGKTALIEHQQSGLFESLPCPLEVTRYHSLLVSDLPPVLEATAWVDDPEERVIMALQHKTQPIYGLQFHPESIATAHGLQMLRHFLRLASAWKASAPPT